ncbi:hypothetical protein FBUS_09052 [Fasciolopsis buskii]|uniref:Uncharacterized protein n=1 Tax=Fasciolopsis buskii TaxID=27845 RepID=A0A8E0RX29_9TREM|nr:hypothetical protein FBUS_09052 [Fasciolopsis buski]
MSLSKPRLDQSVSGSDCDKEECFINLDDNRPPSPLSVQQDGGSIPVQSPPFENESNEKPSSTLSDCSNPPELGMEEEFTVDDDVDSTQRCTTITWETDGHQVSQAASVKPVSIVHDLESDLITRNSLSENIHGSNGSEQLPTQQSAKCGSPRKMPVKKSVQRKWL